jgi:hypothetical protein
MRELSRWKCLPSVRPHYKIGKRGREGTMENVKKKLVAAYLFLLLCHASHIFEEVWGRVYWVNYLGAKTFVAMSLALLCIPIALFFLVLLGYGWARRLSVAYAILMIMNGTWHNVILAVTRKYFGTLAVGNRTGLGMIIMGIFLIYYLRKSALHPRELPR